MTEKENRVLTKQIDCGNCTTTGSSVSMHLGEVTTALNVNMAKVMEVETAVMTETAQAMTKAKIPGHSVADVLVAVVLRS